MESQADLTDFISVPPSVGSQRPKAELIIHHILSARWMLNIQMVRPNYNFSAIK
jgi:hypothetical protein